MAAKNGKDKKQEKVVRVKRTKVKVSLPKQEKIDAFFEKEYRRKNANHINTKAQLSHFNQKELATGKPDGNHKLNRNHNFLVKDMDIYSSYWRNK